jgi:hypothetical protein
MIFRSRHHADAITEFVNREAAHALFPKRKSFVLWRAPTLCPLPLTVIVTGDEPHIPDCVQGHALAIVRDLDRRILGSQTVEHHLDVTRIRIIGVLNEFEDGKLGRTNQLVAKQLQQTGSGPKGLFYFQFAPLRSIGVQLVVALPCHLSKLKGHGLISRIH